MKSIQIKKQSSGQFLLAGVLDQNTIPTIWENRHQIKSDDGQIIIDLGDVIHSDSAGLAFLVYIKSEVLSRKQTVSFVNIPPQLRQLIELSQLEDILNTKQSL